MKVDFRLLEPEPLAGRDANLFLDDVDAGHHLGDRMLDLQPRVRFHEVEAAVRIHQELERPGVGVLHGLGGVDDDRAHPASHLVAERGRGRLFEQLLVPALDRAFAFAEVDDRPVLVAEDLELDMAWRFDVLLEVHIADAERRFGFTLRRLEGMRQLAHGSHDAHAAAAAAGRRLDDDRIADLLGRLDRLVLGLDRSVGARQDRHARLLHDAARPCLVAHQPDDLRGRPDELDMTGFADLREIRALRQEPVARDGSRRRR